MASQGAAAVWLAAWGHGGVLLAAATLGAVVVLAACWVRLRGRWCYEWLSLAAGYASRRRSLGPGADPAALLTWMNPGARIVGVECDGDPAGVIEDGNGLAALLELGDPGALLPAAAAAPLPPLSALLAPGARVQLVVAGVSPATGAGVPATSYRQLTEGRLLAQQRVVLAVQAVRTDGTDEEALWRILTSAVRRVRRRLPATTGVRLLPEAAAYAVLADLAHHAAQPVRETWSAVHVGGLSQATYRLGGWPEARLADLVPRLLALPAVATTVGLTVGPGPRATLAVRLAAADPGALTLAAQALRRLLERHGATAERLDGRHGPALTATLPVGDDQDSSLDRGRLPAGSAAPRPPAADEHPVAPGSPASLVPSVGAGLALGVDRYGEPVMARLFRAEPTRALLIGGVPAAQLLTLRALALRAQVVVESARPQAWEAFVRGVSAPGDPVVVVPPGRLSSAPGAPGTALRPQLVVIDSGPVAGDVPIPAVPWRTALVVRDELTAADLDLLARCDLLVLQPLSPAEAALATGALGLGAASEWLTRIHGDMVGVVNRRTVRWALLSATEVEQRLLGAVARG